MAIVQNYSMPIGDKRDIDFSATDYDCTGQSLVFSIARKQPAHDDFMLQKSSDDGGIVIIEPIGCFATIKVRKADWQDLTPGRYFYDEWTLTPHPNA
jgi:hypothetical protein